MRRRALLASVAAASAGLAGCAFADGDTADDPTTTGSTDDTPPTTTTTPGASLPEPEGYASVVDFETVPRTFAFAPTRLRTDDEATVALWFERPATADHPARLRGWLRNDNPFENTFRVEWIPAVGRVHARTPEYDHRADLHLAPTGDNDLAETVPDLGQTEEGLWYARERGQWVVDTRRLAPGEHVTLSYDLVGDPDSPGRPTGVYEFRGDDETARLTVWNTASPGPETDSRFAGRSVPVLDREGSVAWFHEADRETTAFVRPATERLELDGLAGFEMVHNGRGTLRCGHWNLHKLVDGEWFHVAPLAHTADCRALHPGERLSWPLRAFNGEAVGVGSRCRADGLTAGYLGGGTYGAVVGYGTATDASGALVELVGDPVALVPTGDARVQRDGATATVTTDRHGDGERPGDATLVLTRAESAEERLIAEQLMRSGWHLYPGRGLRNALAAMGPDTERVLVRTDEHAADGATGDSASRRFRFRGQAYEVRRREDGA